MKKYKVYLSQSLLFLRAFQLAITILPSNSLVARRNPFSSLGHFNNGVSSSGVRSQKSRNPFSSLGHFNCIWHDLWSGFEIESQSLLFLRAFQQGRAMERLEVLVGSRNPFSSLGHFNRERMEILVGRVLSSQSLLFLRAFQQHRANKLSLIWGLVAIPSLP